MGKLIDAIEASKNSSLMSLVKRFMNGKGFFLYRCVDMLAQILAIFDFELIKFADALRPDCHIGHPIPIFSIKLEIFRPIF